MPIFNPADLTPPDELTDLISVYSSQITAHISQNQNYYAKHLGLGGTASNLESSIAALVTWNSKAMLTGCLGITDKTSEILNRNKPDGWKCEPIAVGRVMEHHAVVLWKKDKHWQTGIVFDAWVEQKPRLFSYLAWAKEFKQMVALAAPRLGY